MLLLNARSIRNKLAEFRCLVASEMPDIIGITETWIQTEGSDFEGEFELEGYNFYKKDRHRRRGGGVAFFVRTLIRSTRRTIDTQHEVIGVEIEGNVRTVHILLVYRPPHQTMDTDHSLYELLTQLIQNRIAVIIGDFNCNVVWESRTADVEGNRLVDFANENFLEQLVEEPTRGDNFLDLIFSTEENLVSQVTVGEPLGTSDHNTVRCLIQLPTNRAIPNAKRRLNFRLANFVRFKRDLGNLQPTRLESVEASWTNFKIRFLDVQANCIPTRSVRTNQKPKPKWFNIGIKAAMTAKDQAYRRWKDNPLPLLRADHRESGRIVKRLIRVAQHNEERRVAAACKRNPKEFFSHVNSRKPIRASIGPLTMEQGTLTTSNAEVAEELNNYFVSVFTEESEDAIPNPPIRYQGMHPLEDIQCTTAEIIAKIKSLKANKSAGSDGFLPRVIKAVSDEIAPHLLVVFNQSLEEGTVPDDMKVADVTPIHKKGPKNLPGNYRPISLTSVVGKMLESIIADQIVDHLETNNLLGNSQHGFRCKRSCLTNLLEFFHHMISIYDNSRAIDILYLDFKKAFDKVPHKRLLTKVRALGVVGRTAEWIEHWLSDRRQRVVINGESSSWAPVRSGVPQGSVLGPLLFLIYINDLDTGLVSKISKFADDTKLGANAADPTTVASLQQDLDRIGEWSEAWQMPFNTEKCTVMHFGRTNESANYSLLGSQIPTTNLENDLRVYISTDFKF